MKLVLIETENAQKEKREHCQSPEVDLSKVEFNPCFSFSFTIVCSFNNTTAMTCAKSHCGSSSCFKYYKHMKEYRLTFLRKYLPHLINTYF